MGAQAVRLSNIDIDNALENREFEVLFQPIFDLGNGALARMETFVRWRHPKLGVLPPGAFISFFEAQGRMGELSRYVLEEALDHYTRWRGNYPPGFSINLATTDLADPDFPDFLSALLRDRDFPADAVTLECPMPPIDGDIKEIKDQLKAIRATGVRLAIEVRGRANDFLRDVRPFPFDEIKTGGAAILRFARTVRGPGLSAISDLLDIANQAGASIVAVGVEDQASLSALRGLGFSAAQGNHLGKVGGLGDFRPSTVNTVRRLLGLEELSSADLSDLFRTAHLPTSETADDVPETDAELEAHAEDPAHGESENVIERARRKTALLARKKGKDNLRAELAARRKKLGLTDSIKPLEVPVSAARDLQDRLTSAFPSDQAKLRTQAAREAVDEIAETGAIDNNPEPDLSDAIAEPQSADENVEVQTTTTNLPEPAELTTEIAAANEIAADGDVVGDQVLQESAPVLEETDSSATGVTDLSKEQVTIDEPIPDGVHQPDQPVQSDTEPAIDRPQQLSRPAASSLVEVSLDNSAPDKPDSRDADLVFIPANRKPATPTHQMSAGKPLSANRAPNAVFSISAKNIGAYFLDSIHVYTEIESKYPDPIASADRTASIEAKMDSSDLVLVSMDDLGTSNGKVSVDAGRKSPPHKSSEKQTDLTDYAAMPHPSAALPFPKDDYAIEAMGDLDQADLDVDTGDIDVESVSYATQSPARLDEQYDDQFDAETAHLNESLIIEKAMRGQTGRRANFLKRKYRLVPTHFWPRSWRRAWDRRAANRDFVRRAKAAAERLGSIDDEYDKLF